MGGDRRLRIAGLVGAALWPLLLVSAGSAAATPPAGPPYPDAVTGQRVYDYAGIFSSGAITDAEGTIRAIEDRSQAQVAVYTQVKPSSGTPEAASADALALMNQWGVGRKGFDAGLVILFDMQANLQHGQVSLYAGSGFMAAFMTNADRQAVFDNDMKPLLTRSPPDFDGALRVALDDVSAAATPEHADQLSRARILNALVGFGAALLAVALVAIALVRWYTHGRDPIYVDDNSVLMPAPPDGLTPAMATLVMDDRTSSRTVSAAMVDLAARGLLSFRQESALLHKKTSIGVTDGVAHFATPEAGLYEAIRALAGPDGFVATSDAHELLPAISRLKSDLETLAVRKGWLTGKPSRVVGMWLAVALLEIVASIPLFVWTTSLDASGGLLGGAALVIAAVITGVTAWFMPCRTGLGAMLRAMLAAYRRTLQYTIAQSASMNEVVDRKALPWVTTPDAAMAWGVALGLNSDIESLLTRTVNASQASGRQVGWYPMWFYGPALSNGGGGGGGGGTVAGIPLSEILIGLGIVVGGTALVIGAEKAKGGK